MDKLLDILLFKFIDDSTFKPVMSLLLLISITYAINVDRKAAKHDEYIIACAQAVVDLQIKAYAEESEQQYNILTQSFDVWSDLTLEYRTTLHNALKILLDDVDYNKVMTQANTLNRLVEKQLQTVKLTQANANQRFTNLQTLCHEKLNTVIAN